MNVKEAYVIGVSKLKMPRDVLDRAAGVADEMGCLPAHKGPMLLALAIMGVAKAVDPEELSGELTDALALVSRAEQEWRMERSQMI